LELREISTQYVNIIDFGKEGLFADIMGEELLEIND
jgi:hypothetical protein